MRRLMSFSCAGDTLVATLDGSDGATGVLIVAGGRQTRTGPHRLFERLGHALSAREIPTFRFDRRGIGDSDGVDGGYESAAADIIAAAAAFRAACPSLRRIVAAGLCDGATAAALAAREAGIDRLVLLNPWVIDPAGELPPRAAIRATYLQRIVSPRAWLRLIGGRVDLRRALAGLRRLAGQEDRSLFDRLLPALDKVPATILLARRDATAQAFAALWKGRPPLVLDSASHSFASPDEFRAVLAVILDSVGYSAA